MVCLQNLTVILGFIRLISAVHTPAPPIGNRQEDSIFCKAYIDCGKDGLKYFNILQRTLMSAAPVDRTDGLGKFQAAYVLLESESPPILDGFEKDLADHGFAPDAISAWETFSINPHSHLREADSAYENYFDTINGIIIAHMNFNALDSQKALPWSEIMYQNWQLVSKVFTKGGSISNLQAVLQKTVTNLGTRAVLTTLYKTHQLSMNMGDATWYEWTELDQPEFFMALLGTDNVKGTVWLLNDHAAEIKKKDITSIWTRWSSPFPDIWIDIGYHNA